MADTLMHFGVKGMKWGVTKDSKKSKTSKPPLQDSEKSAHRVRLESKYRSRGKTQIESETLAEKRIRTEKILLAVGATVAVAGVAYGAKVAYGKRFADVVIDAGKDLHYVNALGDKADLNRRLYTTFKKGDTQKYRGMLATALRKNAPNTTIYDTVLRTTETIKAPSQREAAKLFDSFKKGNPLVGGIQGYTDFNRRLVDDSPAGREFMSFLKSKGYNAILDSNDQFVSGYATQKPLILFNAKSSTVRAGQTVVSKKLSDRLNRVQVGVMMGKQLAPVVGLGVAISAVNKSVDTRSRHQVVNDYVRKHPNTDKSYADIYASLKPESDGTYRVRS